MRHNSVLISQILPAKGGPELYPTLPIVGAGAMGQDVVRHIESAPDAGFISTRPEWFQMPTPLDIPPPIEESYLSTIIFEADDDPSVSTAVRIASDARSHDSLTLGVALLQKMERFTPSDIGVAPVFDTLFLMNLDARDPERISRMSAMLPKMLIYRGDVCLDPADMFTLFKNGRLGTATAGRANGPEKATESTRRAIQAQPAPFELGDAMHVAIGVSTDSDTSLMEVSSAVSLIEEYFHSDANIIFQVFVDPSKTDEMEIIIVSAGY